MGLNGSLKLYETLVIGLQASDIGSSSGHSLLSGEVWDRGQPWQRLPPSPGLHELIGRFRVFHCGQQFLRLTMNTLHQLLVGIGNAVTLQDRFSSPAQGASLDGAKPEPVDEQGSSLPDDFVLEEELGWLEGMFSEIRFQLEERMEPFAVAGEDGRSILQDGEG